MPLKAVLAPKQLRFALMSALVAVAAYLRLRSALDDFWLDEIWSLKFARELDHPWDAFGIAHDNNHVLNTLYLALIGDRHHWVWYRFLSILCGTATVVTLAKAPLGSDPRESLTTAALAAVAYPLILYASEARGYAPAALFALLAYVQIQRYRRTRTIKDLVLWWATVSLGLLSHLTMVYVVVAIAVWSVLYEIDTATSRRQVTAELLKQYGLLLILAAVYYLVFVRPMVIGGGDPSNPFAVIRRALGLSLGLDQPGALATLASVCAFAAIFAGIFALQRQRGGHWVFFLWVLVLAPALFLTLRPPEFLYFRYFLVCFPFFYLLLGHLLASCYRRGVPGKLLYVAVLALYGVGHGRLLADQFRHGRGGYNAAVQYMAAHSASPVAVVGSDHPFRNKMVLSFYARYLPAGRSIRLVEHKHWPAQGPEWVLTHSQAAHVDPPHRIRGPGGHYYRLVQNYPYARISGWHWFLYRRTRPPSG